MWYGFVIIALIVISQAVFNFSLLSIASYLKISPLVSLIMLLIGVILNGLLTTTIYNFMGRLFDEYHLTITYSQSISYSIIYSLVFLRSLYLLYYTTVVCVEATRLWAASVHLSALWKKQPQKNDNNGGVNKDDLFTKPQSIWVDYAVGVLMIGAVSLVSWWLDGSVVDELIFLALYIIVCFIFPYL